MTTPESRALNSKRSERLRSVIVCGPGRVGMSLILALKSAGRQVSQIIGPSSESVSGLHRLDLSQVPAYAGLQEWRIPDDPHILFLSVPDDVLPETVHNLTRKCSRNLSSGWIALHTSGVHRSSVLEPLRHIGMRVGGWHPLQTFPRPDGKIFSGIPISLEGDTAAVETGREFATLLGALPLILPAELKPLYHCLCTISSSHVAALLLFCYEALRIFPAESRSLIRQGLLNISRAALENLEGSLPKDALTGPVVRGDHETVQKHLDELSRRFPHWHPVYKSLNEYLQQILRDGDKGISPLIK